MLSLYVGTFCLCPIYLYIIWFMLLTTDYLEYKNVEFRFILLYIYIIIYILLYIIYLKKPYKVIT